MFHSQCKSWLWFTQANLLCFVSTHVHKYRKTEKNLVLNNLAERVNNKGSRSGLLKKMDNAIGIHRINHSPADSVVCFVNSHPLNSYL